jgi:hypothetical protein
MPVPSANRTGAISDFSGALSAQAAIIPDWPGERSVVVALMRLLLI